ncbi:hypothetical protein J6590_032965 [Homalodisca vitripennis]|nr:hypothetical protein J6590_032965 [Homalodisca vitripennis]
MSETKLPAVKVSLPLVEDVTCIRTLAVTIRSGCTGGLADFGYFPENRSRGPLLFNPFLEVTMKAKRLSTVEESPTPTLTPGQRPVNIPHYPSVCESVPGRGRAVSPRPCLGDPPVKLMVMAP